jgi:hypothetical protein
VKYQVSAVVSAGRELTINAFPPGQELKKYCRVEAMGDVTGVVQPLKEIPEFIVPTP